MHQTTIPMRLSTMIPVTAPIATKPAVPMLPLPVEFDLPVAVGLVLLAAGPFDGGIGF
jgi:hypothetical protein